MVYEVPVTQARAEFADLVNRVVYGGERVVVTRHGKPLVALVSAADLDLLQGAEQDQPIQGVRHFGESLSNPPPAGSPRHLGIAAKHEPPGR
jgi:prevent-host-death family protein